MGLWACNFIWDPDQSGALVGCSTTQWSTTLGTPWSSSHLQKQLCTPSGFLGLCKINVLAISILPCTYTCQLDRLITRLQNPTLSFVFNCYLQFSLQFSLLLSCSCLFLRFAYRITTGEVIFVRMAKITLVPVRMGNGTKDHFQSRLKSPTKLFDLQSRLVLLGLKIIFSPGSKSVRSPTIFSPGQSYQPGLKIEASYIIPRTYHLLLTNESSS